MLLKKISIILPGIILSITLAMVSIFLSKHIGVYVLGFEKSPISAVMVAIIAGLVCKNLLHISDLFLPGIQFSVSHILKFDIILLGIRLCIFDIFKLGMFGFPVVIFCIFSAIYCTAFFNRILKLPKRLGLLIAVGTSICGVTAIVSTAPTIKAKDEEIGYAIAVITLFGIAATLFYPYLANLVFAGDPLKMGIFLGTAIHDTSQVAGAGLLASDIYHNPEILDIATVSKLVRNLFMTIMIPLISYVSMKESGETDSIKTKKIPLFIIGFLGFALLRSCGDVLFVDMTEWITFCSVVKDAAVVCLVVALASVGMSIQFSSFKKLGLKPLLVGVVAAMTVGIVSILTISLVLN